MMREKLGELVKEFDAVLKPNGRTPYIGAHLNVKIVYTNRAWLLRIVEPYKKI